MTLVDAITIRSADRLIPWIAAGSALPLTQSEMLSTARDDQPSLRFELLAGGRSVAFVEVGVARAPRGVPKATLEIRIDAGGSANVRLRGEDGEANAMFSVAVR